MSVINHICLITVKSRSTLENLIKKVLYNYTFFCREYGYAHIVVGRMIYSRTEGSDSLDKALVHPISLHFRLIALVSRPATPPTHLTDRVVNLLLGLLSPDISKRKEPCHFIRFSNAI